MFIKDRVRELRRVPANSILPNPKNWRTHSKEQLDALKGVLASIGFAGASLTYELPDGQLQYIDGHARAETVGNAIIPVLVLDVTPEEADKLLATFDTLGGMAGIDTTRLKDLMAGVQFENEAVSSMLDGLMEKAGLLTAEEPEEKRDATPRMMTLEYRIVVECNGEQHQAELINSLEANYPGLKVKPLIS